MNAASKTSIRFPSVEISMQIKNFLNVTKNLTFKIRIALENISIEPIRKKFIAILSFRKRFTIKGDKKKRNKEAIKDVKVMKKSDE